MKQFSGQTLKSITDPILLTHLGQMTHIWVSELDRHYQSNGLSSIQYQAITEIIAGVLVVRKERWNFNTMRWFSFTNMNLNMSLKYRHFCPGLNTNMKMI